MKFTPLLLFSACLLILSNQVAANNISVDSVSLEGQVVPDRYVFIEFDISWENSWRTSAVPQNYDAAWVFVKFSVAGGEWQHATLYQTGHIAPPGSVITVSPDSVGVFIYRDVNGFGTVDWKNAGLRWHYGANNVADDAEVQIKVFAIEMVYVPQGPFWVGDGAADCRYHRGDSTLLPFRITSEDAIQVGNDSTRLSATCWMGFSSVSEQYPKGYDAFYCMKYEISNEQYAEFLNTLNRTQQNTRTQTDISGTSVSAIYVMPWTSQYAMAYRNSIRCDTDLPPAGPVNFYCDADGDGIQEPGDAQDVACCYIHWMDLAAYLDWAGLRPLTELEYEKACRGPNYPVANEYAWGNTNIHGSQYSLSQSGFPDEAITGLPTYTGNCAYESTVTAQLRCGIFAASSVNHTRQETGATYYGIMEMSGNLMEMLVSCGSNASESFTGIHGDGILDSDGCANEDYWPGINGNNDGGALNTAYMGSVGVTGAGGSGHRGGNWTTIPKLSEISDRNGAVVVIFMRLYHYGGRGCRIAPI